MEHALCVPRPRLSLLQLELLSTPLSKASSVGLENCERSTCGSCSKSFVTAVSVALISCPGAMSVTVVL